MHNKEPSEEADARNEQVQAFHLGRLRLDSSLVNVGVAALLIAAARNDRTALLEIASQVAQPEAPLEGPTRRFMLANLTHQVGLARILAKNDARRTRDDPSFDPESLFHSDESLPQDTTYYEMFVSPGPGLPSVWGVVERRPHSSGHRLARVVGIEIRLPEES